MTNARLSVVVAGSRPGGPPAAIYDALAAELDDGTVEVIVATARADAAADPPRRGVRVVTAPEGTSVPRLRSAGMRAASAPVVALTEDFCVPSPGWPRALLEEHARGRALAVGGPVLRRGGSASDWAITLCEYGRFLRSGEAAVVHDLPAVNVSYEMARLLELCGDVPDEFVETAVHARLRERGAAFVSIPSAPVFDENLVPLWRAARAQFHHGRLFGGRRVAGRGPAARIVRAAASAAVPFVLLLRITRAANGAGLGGRAVKSIIPLSWVLAAWAAGEATGSLFGEGRSAEEWK